MDIVIAFVCCYFLHKQAFEKGLDARRYVLQYVVGFISIMFLLGVVVALLFGPDYMSPQNIAEHVMWLAPFTLLAELMLYLYLRRRIDKVVVVYEEDEPTTPNDKQDLSYFR
ncbi:MAG: hypothetical protein JST49_11930 [Bacteroidetes bacterium]|nr:hypothetical protein [Bacteroidota bacterium]